MTIIKIGLYEFEIREENGALLKAKYDGKELPSCDTVTIHLGYNRLPSIDIGVIASPRDFVAAQRGGDLERSNP